MVAEAHAGDFRRLARHGRRLQVRVDVLEKGGVPIWAARARRRPTLVLGGALFAAALYWLGQFVWFVHVDGAQTLATADVLRAAERAGLHPGAARHAVRRESVERTLHLELPDLAWAAVELRGTVATVRVVERTGADPSLTQPGHVVAVRDGIVERVSVTAGEALVAPGDTVQAGMPLISGVLTPGSEGYEERAGRTAARGQGLGLSVGPDVVPRLRRRARVSEHAPASGPEADAHTLTQAAVERARRQAAEALPPDAQIVEEDVVVVDNRAVEPRVVRAAVTITVLQNLGRFSPLAADDP